MSDTVEALSIGSIVGGRSPWNSAWTEAIRALTVQIARDSEGVSSPLNVNVVFHVPGHLIKPEYEGVRTGSFSKQLSLLMVQVALPEKPPQDIDADLRSRMRDALAEAERWAKKKKITSDLVALKKLVR
jgi:hypothetical protein